MQVASKTSLASDVWSFIWQISDGVFVFVSGDGNSRLDMMVTVCKCLYTCPILSVHSYASLNLWYWCKEKEMSYASSSTLLLTDSSTAEWYCDTRVNCCQQGVDLDDLCFCFSSVSLKTLLAIDWNNMTNAMICYIQGSHFTPLLVYK